MKPKKPRPRKPRERPDLRRHGRPAARGTSTACRSWSCAAATC